MGTRYVRGMIISLFVIMASFLNFSNLSGTENIRAIHILTLVTAGVGIGVLLTNFFAWLREKRA